MEAGYFWALPWDIPAGMGVPVFGRTHLIWLACALLLALGAAAGFFRMDAGGRKRMMRVCAWIAAGSELARGAFLAASGRFDPSWMLPLHLCGIMIFVELAAVYAKGPLLRELCYCLALPGALGALLTPGETGYPFWNALYLQFITAHLLLFLLPVLLLLDGFRPDFRRLPAGFAFLLACAGLDGAVNAALGGNYLFLRRPPPGSILETLSLGGGSYLFSAAALVPLIWAGLYFPWTAAKIYKPATQL